MNIINKLIFQDLLTHDTINFKLSNKRQDISKYLNNNDYPSSNNNTCDICIDYEIIEMWCRLESVIKSLNLIPILYFQ